MKLNECPVRAALDVMDGKWKPVVLHYLVDGTKRFGELRRHLPEATQKVLTQQLRELERDGVVVRKVYSEKPPRVEYSLSSWGKSLRPALQELCKWGRSLQARHRP